MRHKIWNKEYTWKYNGIMIEGIVEYVGAYGIIASRFPHLRMKEPRQGDWVDLREWKDANGYHGEGYTYYANFGRIDRLNWIDDGDVHVCLNQGSCYLGPTKDMKGAYVSISGGPFGLFQQSDLEPTGELKEGRYWNFRKDFTEGDNGQDYMIKRPVFKLVTNAVEQDK